MKTKIDKNVQKAFQSAGFYAKGKDPFGINKLKKELEDLDERIKMQDFPPLRGEYPPTGATISVRQTIKERLKEL